VCVCACVCVCAEWRGDGGGKVGVGGTEGLEGRLILPLNWCRLIV
jgi:hypothetical protein